MMCRGSRWRASVMRTDHRISPFSATVLVWFAVSFASQLAAETIAWPLAGLDQARQRAESIHCVNNLLRTVRTAQAWANDNHDEYPTNFQCFALDLAEVAPADAVWVPPIIVTLPTPTG